MPSTVPVFAIKDIPTKRAISAVARELRALAERVDALEKAVAEVRKAQDEADGAGEQDE